METNQSPSQVYDTVIAELTALKQKLTNELNSVTTEISGAEQEKQNALKHSVPESIVENIAERVQASVDAFFDSAQDEPGVFDIELSMGYDNKVEICNIDLSCLNVPIEDFILQAFEDECVITTPSDDVDLKS